MGILGWQVYLALLQEDATDGKGDGSVIIVAIFWLLLVNFHPWERQTSGFRDVVARASDTPVPLHCQNHDKALTSWQNQSHRGQL